MGTCRPGKRGHHRDVSRPGTQSPISLLELGLHARSGKVVLLCPDGFWRKGNVDITAERYGIEQVSTMEGLVEAVRARLKAWKRG